MKSILALVWNSPRAWQMLLPAVVLAFYGGFASAQSSGETSADDTDEEGANIEEITVTGSRIRRDTFSSMSPLQVIDGETSRDLGLVDTADLLRQTTVVQGQQITTGLSTSAGLLTDNGPGSSTATLRGLDAGRTLVLVNGRRLAPAGVGGAPSNPDLNLVPGSLIERVDVLLDGASSVYGSDAVAGVVNVILRKDFDGIQLDAYRSFSGIESSGADQRVISGTWGVNSDRGFIGVAAEYTKTNGFAEGDLGNFYEPYGGDCRNTYAQGASGEIYAACSGSFGAGAASTAFGFHGFDGTSQVAGFPPGFFPIPVTADLLTPGSVNGAALLLWPEELNAAFAPDFSRTTIFAIGEHSPGWYGDATPYFEASWSSRKTATNTAGQGRVRVPGDYALGNFGGFDGTLYYQSNFIRDTVVSQTRLTAGIKGDLPGMEFGSLTNWGYDTYINYSRSNGDDAISGIPYFPRLEQTLANTSFDAATGEFVCADRTISGEGQTVTCRPLNFFDANFIATGRFDDPLDNAYLFPNRMTNTVVEQATFQGFITGELFEMPAGGPASLVLGLEYRDDKINTKTDAGAAGGDFFGFSGDPGSNGTRWLREAFMELDLPVVMDRPGFEELSVNIAARWTEEEFFGDEVTYRAQTQYAPVDWLRFRGSVGTSFRAPNLGEQFGGQVTGFAPAGFADPCRVPGVTVPFVDHDNDPNTPDIRQYDPSLENRDATVIANCQNGGGPFNIPATDPFELGVRGLGGQNPVFFGAPTQVASGSNPNLKAETSEALTYGLVFEQPWTDKVDVRLSATYFDIEIEDEVDQLGALTIVQRCYNSVGLVDATCGFITRDPRDPNDDTSGEISFVQALQQNLGKQTVRGIDYNLDFKTDFPLFNMQSPVEYNLIVYATKSLEQVGEEFRATEIFLNDDLGEFGNPEWRLNVTNIFDIGDWRLLFQSRYTGSMIEDNDDAEDAVTSGFSPCIQAGDTFTGFPNQDPATGLPDGTCRSYDNLESYWVHDVSASWRSDSYVVRFGFSNVLDEPPPLTNNNALSVLGGIGYHLTGRTMFVNVTAAF